MLILPMSRSQPWLMRLYRGRQTASQDVGFSKCPQVRAKLEGFPTKRPCFSENQYTIRRLLITARREAKEELDSGVGDPGPLTANIVNSLCRVMESQVWGPYTEELLKPYAKDLSPLLVAAVIQQQESPAMARRFFEWAGHVVYHDAYAFHALLMKLGESKQFADMWALIEDMKGWGCQVNSTTLSIIIKTYGAAGMPHESMEVFSRAHQFNVSLDAHMYTTLLSVLFKAKMIDQARFIYRRMLQDARNVDSSTWATLIRGLGKNGCTKEAEACWDRMLQSGCQPKVVHYNALIEGFCESKSMNKALFTLAAMQEQGFRPNAYTFNPILGALCKAGRFLEALNIFSSMKICAPNQATCNILLEGLFFNEDVLKACKHFEMMEKEGLVDTRSYVLLTVGLKKAKQTDKLMSIYKELHLKHGSVNGVVCNALLQCLCEGPNMDEAVAFFNGLTHPDVASYAMMINCHCKSGKFDEAMTLLADMDNRGCKPNVFCYTPLMGALLKADRVTDGVILFQEMLRRGIETNDVTCGFLLRKLSEMDRVDDVLRVCNHVIDKNICINSAVLAPLMTCLKIAGRIEEADTLLIALERQGCINEQALKALKKRPPTVDAEISS